MAHSESKPQQSVGGVADMVGASGSYSNSAITALHAKEPLPASKEEQILAAKISRAMSSGLSTSPGTPRSRRWTRKAMS
jgi:hypothetical protein